METTLTLAALIQCTTRMLWRLAQRNQRWRIYDNFLVGENRWRAMRHGTTRGMIDFGARRIEPFAELVEEWLELIAEDAQALDCVAEVDNIRVLAARTSAEEQREVHAAAIAAGATPDQALRAIVMALIEDFTRDL